jgi:hypothetical protein
VAEDMKEDLALVTLVANARRAPHVSVWRREGRPKVTEVAMLSRTIVSVLAFAVALGVTPIAGAAMEVSSGSPCASPFENVTSVTPYKVTRTNLRRSSTRLEGAVVNVAAQPGLTREWLQRQVSSAPASDEPSSCPLAVNGASARVTSTGDGFAITVSSTDRDGAKEILRRAQALSHQ